MQRSNFQQLDMNNPLNDLFMIWAVSCKVFKSYPRFKQNGKSFMCLHYYIASDPHILSFLESKCLKGRNCLLFTIIAVPVISG